MDAAEIDARITEAQQALCRAKNAIHGEAHAADLAQVKDGLLRFSQRVEDLDRIAAEKFRILEERVASLEARGVPATGGLVVGGGAETLPPK